MHPLQVETLVDETELTDLVEAAHQILIVEDVSFRVISACLLICLAGEGPEMIWGEPERSPPSL
jgi:hypothetical protein